MSQYFSFFLKDLSFSFIILTIGFVFGWIVYRNVVVKDVSLKEALFKKDNLAAWIEFIGAFVFPVLYLSSVAIRGSVSENIFADLSVCITYTVFYTAILTIARLLSKSAVNLINAEDGHGRICLNKEIYDQKNIAAALFSVSLSLIFVSIIKYIDFIDIINGLGAGIVFRILLFLVFMLLAIVCYIFALRKKTTLFKELFIDNNAAAGISFLGFVFAVQTIITGVISAYEMDFDLVAVSVAILVSLIVFGIVAFFFKMIFTKLVKVNIWNEVYEDNNAGAAIGQIALYIGIAGIIVNFIM